MPTVAPLVGLPEDDSFGFPGWKSNVTIKRCRTVVLDVDMNVQLFSLVIWGHLEIKNRLNAQVSRLPKPHPLS